MGKKKKERERSKGEKNPALHLQPNPKSDRADVWPLVIDDMNSRNHLGKVKYGIPLRIHNGRDALVDAYQEVLDLSVYLRQEIEERRTLDDSLESVRRIPGFERLTAAGIGETIEMLAERVETLTRQSNVLSATLIHYKTHSSYIAGCDDGIEKAISAFEKVLGESFTQEKIKEIYEVIDSETLNAKV